MSSDPPPLPTPENWHPVRSSRVLGRLELLPDGGIKLGDQVFPPQVGLRNVDLDGLQITKSVGPDVKLAVADEHGQYRFLFKNAKWYERASVRQQRPQVFSP